MAASHGRRRSNTSPSTSQAPGPRGPRCLWKAVSVSTRPPMGKGFAGNAAEAAESLRRPAGRRQRERNRYGSRPEPRGPRVRHSPHSTDEHHQPRFADRHIGPDADAIATMLEVIGVDSLDELAAKALPAGILDALTADGAGTRPGAAAAAGHRGTRRWPNCVRWPTANTVAVSMIGQGYYDTLTPPVLLPQHPGEPGLVHRLHAVPARDQPGPARGAAELPDHGRRPDRPGGRQRVDARRGHRGRRGDDADAPRGARARPTGWPSTSTCSRRPRRCWPPAPSRSASRSSPPTCATACPTASSSASSSSCPAPAAGSSTGRRLVAEAHDRGALVAVGADLLALTLITPPGEYRRRRRLRHHPTFRCANGIRRPARRIPGGAHQARPSAARPAGRRVRGRRRLTGLPAGAADPRAAHPPRQGDQQHLHRAGAAGGDGRDVRQLPRRRRADRDRAPRARPRAPWRSGRPRRATRWCTTRSSTPCWPGSPAAPTRCSRRGQGQRHQPVAASTPTTSRWPATRPPPTTHVERRCWRRSAPRAAAIDCGTVPRSPPAHSEFLTHPAFTATAPRPR